VPVVRGHRRELDLGDGPAVEQQLAPLDAVRRARVDAHGDDRPPQSVRPAGERDLLRRPPHCRLAELGQQTLVEREDEVRLGFHGAVEVVGERRGAEGDPRSQQVLL
jgi:hypothetical protein